VRRRSGNTPRHDQNGELRERTVALAHRYRRYGAGMIHLKLRQEGRRLNHKRVDRLYAGPRLQVKRRRRKKVPVMDRQPLARPERCNDVWAADLVFDRTAEGRVLKCLPIVDDAFTEAVAIEAARAMGGRPVNRCSISSRSRAGYPGSCARQRPRVLQPRDAAVGARAGRHAATD
jgi:transposase InsO family protein